MVSRERLRFVWGLGIGLVMLVAVGPYPVLGLVADDEIPHRIHNTVGALQYLPLWVVPVLMFVFGRDRANAWRIALMSSVAMAAVGVWSGDLVESLSWMPLITLLVLWPRDVSWRPNGMSVAALAGFALVAWVTAVSAPDLVNLQRLQMGDTHSTRFHFSGMAAAYLSLSLTSLIVAFFNVRSVLRMVVGASSIAAGICSLLWPDYESALARGHSWMLVVAGVFVALPRRERPEVANDVDVADDELIGVYNADGTVVGEVAYWIGARFGRAHCSLCEITHGTFRVKDEWVACERGLSIPFRTFHRDDAPADVLRVADGRFPIVVRRTAGAVNVVMTPEQVDSFHGSPESFTEALTALI